MPNLRMLVDASGTVVSNDDLPARDIIAGTDMSVTKSGANFVLNVSYTLAAGSGMAISQSGSTKTIALTQQSPLTAQLTTITHTEPSVADYALQDITQLTPYGFTTANEARTLLKVVANLQTRMAELEARLQSAGLL